LIIIIIIIIIIILNLKVEWDEPGCGDKQNRVSAWEIETPESLFLFPSLTSGFKRPFHPGFFGECLTAICNFGLASLLKPI